MICWVANVSYVSSVNAVIMRYAMHSMSIDLHCLLYTEISIIVTIQDKSILQQTIVDWECNAG